MIRIGTALLLMSSLAFAQTSPKVHALGIIDDNRSISISAFPTDDKSAVRLFTFYSDVENATKVVLKTGSATLVTCTTAICNWEWPKADMVARKCVQCPITVTVTDKLGKTHRIDTMVLRP
jgi:hypothetical protein